MTGLMATGNHLVHGMGTALEAPTWPIISDAQARELLALFPAAGDFCRLSWHSPRPFSAAALVHTDRDAFVLKRHHRQLRSPVSLAQEHAFMAHLRVGGLQVPEVMLARDGTGAIAHGDWTYELHRKAPGLDLYRDRPSWTPFLSHAHAFVAGAALARLHLAARGFAGATRERDPLVGSFTILPSRDPLASAQAYIGSRPALARFLAGKPWQAELGRLFAALGEGLAESLEDQPPLWTHNDWHPSNLLWSAGGDVSTVFDFGMATRTCAIQDLATAIERTAVSWLDLADGTPDQLADLEAALQLIAGYRTLIPITAAQVRTIVRLLSLVHIEFALSEVDYFAGILHDHDQAEVAWQDYGVGHADWFLSPPGQAFLHDLENGATI